jgi:hypothetical protein
MVVMLDPRSHSIGAYYRNASRVPVQQHRHVASLGKRKSSYNKDTKSITAVHELKTRDDDADDASDVM